MNNKTWKYINKPSACTRSPWDHLLPKDKKYELRAKIKSECIDIYGYSFEECPKRLLCIKKTCIGRPLPFSSPTARPYLEKLRKTQKIVNNELYIQRCDGCPIVKTCTRPCAQVNDFTNRHKITEPQLYYKYSVDNFVIEDDVYDDGPLDFFGEDVEVPWDCISDKRQKVIRMYLYEQRDFKTISEKLNLNNQARTKYEFYAGLTTLSEYGIMRNFMRDNYHILTPYQSSVLNLIYNGNITLTEVSKLYKISKQAIQQLVDRIVKNNKIRWTVFVKKEGKKVIYNVPELFK